MNEGRLRRKQRWNGSLRGPGTKRRVTVLQQAVADVKGLQRPRLGMWPLTKKAKPGRSSNRKGFFGRNHEQREAGLQCEVQT